jgi:hypothetical protein
MSVSDESRASGFGKVARRYLEAQNPQEVARIKLKSMENNIFAGPLAQGVVR